MSSLLATEPTKSAYILCRFTALNRISATAARPQADSYSVPNRLIESRRPSPYGYSIYETATRRGKRVQALGGAKNHMVVLPDADIGMAADAAVSAAFGAAGERCMAVSVVVAVGGIADPLVDAIKSRMQTIRIGPGLDEGSEMGPLISREHRDRVVSYLDSARRNGATVAVDGRDSFPERAGFFLGASLVDHVKPGMSCYDDEIFGPLLSIRSGTHV